MKVLPQGRPRRLTWLLWPLFGLAVSGLLAPVGGPRRVREALARTGTPHPVTDVVEVPAQVSGTVAKVHVAPRQHVTAGTPLLELEQTEYREALVRARARVSAARKRATVARSDLTAQERAVSAAIRVALDTVPRLQPAPPARTRPQISGDGTAVALERARAQLAAAQTDVVRAAEAHVATARDMVDRDKVLLSQGAIPARQMGEDSAAYQSALGQAQAAEAALRKAQQETSSGAAYDNKDRTAKVEQAQRTVVAAQGDLRAAEAELAARQQAVDRDKMLLAEGAIPAQQLNADNLAYDGKRARVAAAAAAVQHAQVQLEAVRTERPRTEASSRASPLRRRDVSRAERLAHLAQTRILEAKHGAQHLAVAEAEVVGAEGSLHTAELDVDRTLIRAPVDGWVTNTMAKPGEPVRSGQFVVSLSTPRRPASVSKGAGRTDQDPPSRRERLEQIAAEERLALTRLRAESEQIKAIILRSAGEEHSGPVPTLLRDLLRRPVQGEISSGYGWRIHPIFQTLEFHTGIDIAAPWGAPVEASADGTVIFAGEMPANGKLLILDHGNGLSTTYSHLSSYAVQMGDRVRRGQIVARIGSTGWSTGPHLFFEVRDGGQPIDPLAP